MSYFQRIKGVVFGILLLMTALLLFLFPVAGYYIAATILGLSLFVYGFRLLWYYFSMARHMVGGKTSLYRAIIVLDLALFTASVTTLDITIIVLYLLGVYAFSGFVTILRAFEAKRVGGAWQFKLANGIVMILFAVALTVFGMFRGKTVLLVYGYALSLTYSAVMRIVTSLRKSAIVFIQ